MRVGGLCDDRLVDGQMAIGILELKLRMSKKQSRDHSDSGAILFFQLACGQSCTRAAKHLSQTAMPFYGVKFGIK